MKAAQLLCAWALAMTALPAQALDAGLPQIEQRIGARLPLQERYTDDDGSVRQLSELLQGKPVLLVPGYYHCPDLCSTVFQTVLQSLAASDLRPDSYRLLGLSIDPTEDATMAASKKAAWLGAFGRRADVHFLTGQERAIAQLLQASGWPRRYDRERRQYLHPAGLMVLSPDGRIARYFPGLSFQPQALRQALTDAAAGRQGTLAERLLLLCGHEGFVQGRHSQAAIKGVRLLSLGLLLGLLGAIWRLRRQGAKPPAPSQGKSA